MPYFEMCCYDQESVEIFFQKLVKNVDKKQMEQELDLALHYESLNIREKEIVSKKKKFSCCQIL